MSKYQRPYTYEQLVSELGQEAADRLYSDPVHKWRADTGIELIHREPDLAEQRRIIANWMLMSDEDKAKSDEMSIKFNGMTNQEFDAQIWLEHKREMMRKLAEIAEYYSFPLFAVTDGASITRNNGSAAVKAARDSHKAWEVANGYDPDEDWSKKARRNRLYDTLVKLHSPVKVVIDPKYKYRGEYSKNTDTITLRDRNPIVLAHELGHREDFKRILRMHALLGGFANLTNWQELGKYATYLKERAAVDNSLDILREAAASEEVIDFAKRDADRYLKEVRGD